MIVYVLNQCGNPIMPCCAQKARKLLKAKAAKVVRRAPFTIQLLTGVSYYKQEVHLKVDVGNTIGVAAVTITGNVLYAAEVVCRKDIKSKMEYRADRRRGRRSRKTRYRLSRFDNRTRTDGWLTPTLNSKVQSHVKAINSVKRLLPTTQLFIEKASFDTHKISNPTVSGKGYQNGPQKDFYNTKAYVLHRDKHTCQQCKGKSKDKRLEVHHIVFRSNGGANAPNNLIALCKTCHDALHALPNAVTQSLKLSKKLSVNTAPATQVSTISAYLEKIYPNAMFTFGYETKFNREQQQLPKAHFIDAMCIAHDSNTKLRLPNVVYKMVSINKGDYQQTECQPKKKPNPTGVRPKIPRDKICGFKRFDRVIYHNCEAFIKGRMSTGYGILEDIDGTKLDFGHIPKLKLMKRVGARKTCLISPKVITNITSNTISYSSANIVKTFSKGRSKMK